MNEATWQVHHGISQDLLERVGDQSVDAIVTDPPYAKTGTSSSWVSRSKNRGIPKEGQFFEAWIREQLQQWQRVLKPDGAIFFTMDWFGAVQVDTACRRLGWKVPSIGVWDRENLGAGHVLRRRYENFVVITMPQWKRHLRGEPDLWRIRWFPSDRKRGHAAEKPVELFDRALRLLLGDQRDRLVFDPFCGTGTSGIAALHLGHRYIGFEREPDYAAVARKRLTERGLHESG
ncbi:MAG: site-specific DNA-methyltransferase [Myxococcota bacterium]